MSLTGLNASRSQNRTAPVARLAAGRVDGVLHPLGQRAAVEQPGQRVDAGPPGELLVLGAPVADVLELADAVQRPAGAVAHDRRLQRHPHQVPVGVQVALLELVPLDLAVDRTAQDIVVAGLVVRVGDVADRQGLQLAAAAAEHPGHRLVDPQEAPGGLRLEVDERHAERCVLEGDPERLLAGAHPRDEPGVVDGDAGLGGVHLEQRALHLVRPPAALGQVDRQEARRGSPETEYIGANSASSGCHASGSSLTGMSGTQDVSPARSGSVYGT